MKALVTGATGFIGANLVRELLSDGCQVQALVRKKSPRRNIEGLDIEVVYGDLRDAESLRAAVAGCEALFHVAASYNFWTPHPEEAYDTNVTGTENIIRAACAAGVQKIVYTSTESTIGASKNGRLPDETRFTSEAQLAGHYKKSKFRAEQAVLRLCREGAPVVTVNPTTPVGPYDVKPTPTGQFVLDFINGRMPAYVNTGLNLIDVRDVACGHILALEKGDIGERYILGHRNLTFREILAILEQITGIKAPKVRLPLFVALGAACVDEAVEGRLLGRPPRIPLAGVKTARKYRHFNCSRAVRELGLPQTPVEQALERAVEWFRDNGYTGPGQRREKL